MLRCSYQTQWIQRQIQKTEFRPKELNDLLALKLAPNVTTSLLERISELHMSHSGLKTSLAELKYLETASKLPLYGLHQFHVKDGEETHIILSVYSGGIMVFEKGKFDKIHSTRDFHITREHNPSHRVSKNCYQSKVYC